MSEDVRGREPERLHPDLLVLDPELGPLLEQANGEYAAGLDEATAFQRLAERLTLPVKRGHWQRLSAGLVASLAAAGLALLGASLIHFERDNGVIVVGPEASAPSAGKVTGSRETAARETASRETARETALPEQVEIPRPALISERKPNSVSSRATSSRGEKLRSSSQPAGPEPAPQEDCLALARHGQAQEAERCFGARAAGSGLGAEMALYEMARLRRDVLHDTAGALAVLGEYRERFARGSLRNEVDLSRVELLALLGRGREALQESAELLGSATGRERAAELHLLRGNVYRHDLGDLRAAAGEYAQVEAQGGVRGAHAAALRAACLEALQKGEARP